VSPGVALHVWLCVCVFVGVFVRVCVCERERERECVCECVGLNVGVRVCRLHTWAAALAASPEIWLCVRVYMCV